MVASDLIQRKVVEPFELKAKHASARADQVFQQVTCTNYLALAPTRCKILSILLPRIENRYAHRWNLSSISRDQRQVVLQGSSR